MTTQRFLLILIIAVTAALLLKKSGPPSGAPKKDNAKVVHLVEETLHEHQGEDNPVVQAFEAALAQEAKV